MRLAVDFGLKSYLKVLYCTFFRPILEYGTVIWDPHTTENDRQLERIRPRFFRLASCFCLLFVFLVIIIHLLFSGLVSLAELKRFFKNKFLKCLVSGDVDFPTLLSLISFNALLVLLLCFTFLSVSLITWVMNPLGVWRLMPMRSPLLIFNYYALFKTDVYVLCLYFVFLSCLFNCLSCLRSAFLNRFEVVTPQKMGKK